jgi:hypothetical protein
MANGRGAAGDDTLAATADAHMGGDVIPLAPLADLLRQVRRSAPDVLRGSETLAR